MGSYHNPFGLARKIPGYAVADTSEVRARGENGNDGVKREGARAWRNVRGGPLFGGREGKTE